MWVTPTFLVTLSLSLEAYRLGLRGPWPSPPASGRSGRPHMSSVLRAAELECFAGQNTEAALRFPLAQPGKVLLSGLQPHFMALPLSPSNQEGFHLGLQTLQAKTKGKKLLVALT